MNKIENAIAKSEIYNRAIRRGADIRSDALEDAARTISSGQMWASGIRGIGGALAPSLGSALGSAFSRRSSYSPSDVRGAADDMGRSYSDMDLILNRGGMETVFGPGGIEYSGPIRGSW